MATYRKRGSRWHVQIRRKEHPSLTRSFDRKVDADNWVRRTERQIDVGELSVGDPEILNKMKLWELFERYSETISTKKRGCGPEQYRLGSLSRSSIGTCLLAQLTPKVVSQYRDKRLEERSPSSVLKELQLLKSVLQIASCEWGIPLKNDPLSGVTLPKAAEARKRRLEAGEFDALIRGCQLGRSPLLAPVIIIAIETGMRRGEIVNMRWGDLDLGAGTLHIPITKNGHSRTIPLTSRAITLLQGLPRNDERVFPTSGNAIRLAWERLKRRVGIDDLRFHDLRHEAISRFFEMGLSVPEVALISGHRDPRMLFRYTHLRAEEVGKKLK
jgi:integrase